MALPFRRRFTDGCEFLAEIRTGDARMVHSILYAIFGVQILIPEFLREFANRFIKTIVRMDFFFHVNGSESVAKWNAKPSDPSAKRFRF